MVPFIRNVFIIFSISITVHSTYQNTNEISCTIIKYNADDIEKAQTECTDIIISELNVPAGEILDLTHLKQGSKVTFRGTTTWEYSEWKGPLVRVSGTDVEIIGESGHILDGRGNLWWDGLGGNGGKTKPKFFNAVDMYNSSITNINIKNSPVHVFSIQTSVALILRNVTIDNKDGDSLGRHNTDGFDISNSVDVTIEQSTVYNQDDCLAVKSGSDLIFRDNFCSGGHGISIGGVSNASVANVLMQNSYVENSENGVRIKTNYGAIGSVTNITFQDITLKDITKYGIIIEGDYLNGGPTGTPTDGVPITGLTLKNITGTVKDTGTNIYVLVKKASDWHWSEINVMGGKVLKECEGIPAESGISC